MRRPDRRRDARQPGRAGPDRDAPHGVRSFLAVLLPAELRARVDAAAEPLRERAGAVSWVKVENFHLTLRFFGAIDETTIGRVREAMGEAAAETAPFTVALGGFGGFPSARSPRVFWVGLTAGGEALGALHAGLERALAARGIPPEGRAFHAHLTLGRARDPRGVPGLAGGLEGLAAALGETAVDAVCLMRSDLHPAGARHSVLAREPLVGASRAPARVDLMQSGP